MAAPRIALGPRPADFAAKAVLDGGGVVVEVGESPDAVIWLDHRDAEGLRAVLQSQPTVRWIQLPFAGIDVFNEAGVVDGAHLWTSAKGAYAEPVAEHGIALALAGLRVLRTRVEARSWGEPEAETLFDSTVTILGGGGITRVLLDLLAPYRVHAIVLRRNPQSMEGAEKVATLADLHRVLPGSRVVFLALSLTAETRHVIGAKELSLMDSDAWLVNIARGPHVDTDALVQALRAGSIGGAALDVTDPEPLPDRHPLWEMSNCIVTPHTADTPEMVRGLLAERIRANVERFARGDELIGLVDPAAGY